MKAGGGHRTLQNSPPVDAHGHHRWARAGCGQGCHGVRAAPGSDCWICSSRQVPVPTPQRRPLALELGWGGGGCRWEQRGSVSWWEPAPALNEHIPSLSSQGILSPLGLRHRPRAGLECSGFLSLGLRSALHRGQKGVGSSRTAGYKELDPWRRLSRCVLCPSSQLPPQTSISQVPPRGPPGFSSEEAAAHWPPRLRALQVHRLSVPPGS